MLDDLIQPEKNSPEDELLGSKMICMCMGVSELDIKHAVKAGAKNYLDVQAATNAGLGCGTCPAQVEELVKKYRQQNLETKQATATDCCNNACACTNCHCQ